MEKDDKGGTDNEELEDGEEDAELEDKTIKNSGNNSDRGMYVECTSQTEPPTLLAGDELLDRMDESGHSGLGHEAVDDDDDDDLDDDDDDALGAEGTRTQGGMGM